MEGNTDRVEVELCWAGGFTSRHTLIRPVQTCEQLSNYDELVAPIKALRAQRKTLSEIATKLNAERFHPPKRVTRFTKEMLRQFLRDRGERTGPLPRSVTDEQHLASDEWWLSELAWHDGSKGSPKWMSARNHKLFSLRDLWFLMIWWQFRHKFTV